MVGPRPSVATLVVTLAIALVAFGLAVAAPGQAKMQLRMTAAGALGLTSSRDGDTLFAATNMRPGQAVSGTLRITNTGSIPAILAVRPTGMAESAGTGGGRLSGRLALIISDVSSSVPVQLWAGRPNDFGEARLAILAPGESRDLVVTAALAAATAGNAYQGAAIQLGLTWGARPVTDGLTPGGPAATPVPTRTPTPAPVPSATPVPVPAPLPVDPNTPADISADEIGLPGANACLSRRTFKIHLRGPHHAGIRSARVKVGSKPAKTVRGRGRRKVAVGVSLRGFTRRKVAVRIDLRTTDGHRYRSKRTYRVCAGR